MSRLGWFDQLVVRTGFLQRYPFYAAVLAQLGYEATERVPVMAVRWDNGRYVLLVNEPYFAAEPRYRRGVLLHEVHHIVLGHLAHPRFFDVERPDLMQLAMEISANEYIQEPLPGPILWQQFTAFGVGPDQGTVERYELLRGAAGRRTIPIGLMLDHHGGDGATTPGVGIDELVRGEAAPSGAAAAARLLLERARTGVRDLEALAAMTRGDAASRAAADTPEQASEPADAQSTGRYRGLLGNHDADALVERLTPPRRGAELDWRQQLRAFVRRGPDRAWHRPDRRQPHRLLEVPGRSWRGGRTRILVAIDTSGSMGAAELRAVGRELLALSRHAELTLVECDQRIQRVRPFPGRLDDVSGRGGTDLRPPFQQELLRRHGRDGVVYFTDGQGPWPWRAPPVPVLWVLTGPHPFGCPWGRRARLERIEELQEEDWDVPF